MKSRGISENVINRCIRSGTIYESEPYHNVVFVGFDEHHVPRYAALRGTGNSTFKGDVCGSDKAYSFQIHSLKSDTVRVFESAIDLLSFATLMEMNRRDPMEHHLLSLSGVNVSIQHVALKKPPAALAHFLEHNPSIQTIYLHLDNDFAGRNATRALVELLSDQYSVIDMSVPFAKDVNDYLCCMLREQKHNKRDLYDAR